MARSGQSFVVGAVVFSSLLILASLPSGPDITQENTLSREYSENALRSSVEVFNREISEEKSVSNVLEALFSYNQFLETSASNKGSDYSGFQLSMFPREGEAAFVNHLDRQSAVNISAGDERYYRVVQPEDFEQYSIPEGSYGVNVSVKDQKRISPVPANFPDDPIAYYPLNDPGDGIVEDRSGEKMDGDASGVETSSASVSSELSSAGEFDNIDKVDLQKLDFSGDESITVSFWHRVDPEAGDKNNFFGFGSTNGGNTFSIRTRGDGSFKFYFWANDLNANTENYYGDWVHTVAKYDAAESNRSIWFNGSHLKSDSPSNPNFQNQNYQISGYNGEYIDGKVAELRVYDRAITEEEVQSLYKNPSGLTYFSNSRDYSFNASSPSFLSWMSFERNTETWSNYILG